MRATKETVKINNEEIDVHRIDNDTNGNPRYVVHFMALGVKLDDYTRIHIPGFHIYRAKWFGGGYVFQSYNVKSDLEYALEYVKNYYK